MKYIALVLCFAAVALASPQLEEIVQILRDDRVDQGDGNFNYAFEADNGIAMEVVGTPDANGASAMRGFYVLPLADGGFARVEFVADANGFQPVSDVLPVAPPAPPHVEELLRIADQLRAEGVTFDDQGRRL